MVNQGTKQTRVGVIAGFKASDAALCSALEQSFPNLTIVRYRIPIKQWIPWLLKKITNDGFFVLLGHLELSVFLRLQRLAERLVRPSLWLRYTSRVPSWSKVQSPIVNCYSETQAIKALREVDVIVFLDALRMSHRFHRQCKAQILQIIWSNLPQFYGDSGSFWSFSLNKEEPLGVSLILRGEHFNKFIIVSKTSIASESNDDLRTIKIKQVLAVANILLSVIKRILQAQPAASYQPTPCRIFRPPTLFTYLKFLKHHSLTRLPNYAVSESVCQVADIS